MCNELATTSAYDYPARDIPQCPKCRARLNFVRSAHPDIDSCGFESYRLDCQECGATLAGIIDPVDNALLVSECDPPRQAASLRVAV
jgi:hypothetical protein